ncbi:hypothetical protein D3C73_1178230 [compost metagenome]
MDKRFNLSNLTVIRLRTALQERFRILLQQAQHAGQLAQMRGHSVSRRHIFTLQTVDLTRHIKQHRVGFRRIEIIVHCFNETRFKGITTGWRHGFVSTAQRGVQTLQCRTCLLQVLFAVVQLATIVAGHQEVANGFGVVVFQHVAHGKEVAQ